VTVHSVPTIGATFTNTDRGNVRRICVVGDNHSMTFIRDFAERGMVSAETLEGLEQIYRDNFSLLVADGGAGAIHGDPADALQSASDRVIFVHIEELPNEFRTTFSLANSGKRYTVIDSDPSVYTSQVNHYLSPWLGDRFPNRWMRSLLADEEIRRYNAEDVIIVQGAKTRDDVYLILTGYCNVVRHHGQQSHTVAHLQAGDIIGEMAVITGRGSRNASVVARTPVTVCMFPEETFSAFVASEGLRDRLLQRWSLRPVIKSLPYFAPLTPTVIEKVGRTAEWRDIAADSVHETDGDRWYLMVEDDANATDNRIEFADELGWLPFSAPRPARIETKTPCRFVTFERTAFEALRLEVPELNYRMRKLRIEQNDPAVDWMLGLV